MVAKGIFEFVGHGNQTIGKGLAVCIAGEIVRDEFGRSLGIEQASVAAVQGASGEIFIECAVGVDVDMVDAEGREPIRRCSAVYFLLNFGNHRNIQQIDKSL